ncbi:MAG: hypothetical protein J5582_14280 [Ruminococcus sp.]|uniref:hypothetical protein n=1 Tax=Ruminococcus sp. TaxID=41978 RepID=UPI0025CC87BD|nr:hypothetical protein [Ruminococcus sp.]MBO4867704.1 hypothetical protein [Ruminococcus sp.]
MAEELLPRHLRGLIAVDDSKSDSAGITGQVRCSCGCDKMKLRCFGLDNTREDDWKFGINVSSECIGCGKTHLLFDQAVHGYDGFACHSYETVNDKRMSPVICHECGAEIFKTDIGIELEDKEQFIEECVEEFPDEFREEDFTEAFNWLTMTIKCEKCGYEEEIINLELS